MPAARRASASPRAVANAPQPEPASRLAGAGGRGRPSGQSEPGPAGEFFSAFPETALEAEDLQPAARSHLHLCIRCPIFHADAFARILVDYRTGHTGRPVQRRKGQRGGVQDRARLEQGHSSRVVDDRGNLGIGRDCRVGRGELFALLDVDWMDTEGESHLFQAIATLRPFDVLQV